jgi:hypothetical protein
MMQRNVPANTLRHSALGTLLACGYECPPIRKDACGSLG